MNMADRGQAQGAHLQEDVGNHGHQQHPEPDEQHAAEEGEVTLGGRGIGRQAKKVSAVPPSAVITISPPPLFMYMLMMGRGYSPATGQSGAKVNTSPCRCRGSSRSGTSDRRHR